MRQSDKNLIQCSLNIYARHLRGFKDNRFAEDLKRVEELRTKEISANNVVIAIKLEV